MAQLVTRQEREALNNEIWKIADDMRGSVDGWDFKSYVLGAMLYRFLSEHLTDYVNAPDPSVNYASRKGEIPEEIRQQIVEEIGYFIPPKSLFENVCKRLKLRDISALDEELAKIFQEIIISTEGASSEKVFRGLFADFNVNSNKLGGTPETRRKKLEALLFGVDAMDLRGYRDGAGDAFGDAYEFLMKMYASNAGKSGGEFYTPSDVSELLARLAINGRTDVRDVYDPACGSGSLLLKVALALKTAGAFDTSNLRFNGQEINVTTYNLCRINMILHGVSYTNIHIFLGDTLTEPKYRDDDNDKKDTPFDVIVSNPPYSIKWNQDGNDNLIEDERYSPAGVLAPKTKADLAFVLHSLFNLSPQGAAAIVCFPGIMYRGGAEQKIRKYLIDNNYVDCVIQLPSNLFFGTSIATCIMVLRKNKKVEDRFLFIDASNEFIKVTNNNRLTPENIERIYQAYHNREEIEYFSHLVTMEEIQEHDYNLSVSSYVEQRDTREKVDITALNAEIKEIVAREERLRQAIDQIVAEIENTRE